MDQSDVNRRDFLKTTAAGAAALSLTAASAGRVYGANERIRVAFLGTGGRCMSSHVKIINKLKKEGKGVEPVAVCDVWDGDKAARGDGMPRGLYPAAEACGLDPANTQRVTKDYRKILDNKDVDVVCIAAPDHWHAKMAIDAAEAGKDVYCEKPMVKTIDEAWKVVEVMKKHDRVMTVGVQSMADPTWRIAHEHIAAGKIGHVAQAQTSYYRNSDIGQWRYYPLTKSMTPKTVDWPMFLGHKFSVFPDTPLGPSEEQQPFDRAVYGQWRCYWPFGGGMFTDLFVHQTTHMIRAMGVRQPRRVVGAGGIYLEYDGRDVPDVAVVVADYDEGCQLLIQATMIAAYPVEEVIRGHLGTIKFVQGGFEIIPETPKGSPGIPARLEKSIKGQFVGTNPPGQRDNADTEALWLDFLDCVRARKRTTLSTPELGAAAFTTVALGVQSYRHGQALLWDKDNHKASLAGDGWAEHWEKMSKDRDKPKQVIGWHADDTGSLLHPRPYMKWAGPWKNGHDPADGATGSDQH